MTFNDLVKYAVKMNYRIESQKDYNELILEINDLIKIIMIFPNDEVEKNLGDHVNINWEYTVINKENQKKIHSDWLDYYGGTPETKLQDMKNDILEYINNFALRKFEIVEKSVFSLFGKKFLRYKELIFQDN